MYEGDVAYSNYLKQNSTKNAPFENLGLMEIAPKPLSREEFFNKEGYDINYTPTPNEPISENQPINDVLNPPGVIEGNFTSGKNPYGFWGGSTYTIPDGTEQLQGSGFTTLDKSIPEGTDVTPSTLPQINNGNVPTVQQYNQFLYEQEVKSKTDNIFRMINPYGK
tara:strand:- start:79 stop:573 length:495 start_codon:yes stop_codon:yes gene_type:complete